MPLPNEEHLAILQRALNSPSGTVLTVNSTRQATVLRQLLYRARKRAQAVSPNRVSEYDGLTILLQPGTPAKLVITKQPVEILGEEELKPTKPRESLL